MYLSCYFVCSMQCLLLICYKWTVRGHSYDARMAAHVALLMVRVSTILDAV